MLKFIIIKVPIQTLLNQWKTELLGTPLELFELPKNICIPRQRHQLLLLGLYPTINLPCHLHLVKTRPPSIRKQSLEERRFYELAR